MKKTISDIFSLLIPVNVLASEFCFPSLIRSLEIYKKVCLKFRVMLASACKGKLSTGTCYASPGIIHGFAVMHLP